MRFLNKLIDTLKEVFIAITPLLKSGVIQKIKDIWK